MAVELARRLDVVDGLRVGLEGLRKEVEESQATVRTVVHEATRDMKETLQEDFGNLAQDVATYITEQFTIDGVTPLTREVMEGAIQQQITDLKSTLGSNVKGLEERLLAAIITSTGPPILQETSLASQLTPGLSKSASKNIWWKEFTHSGRLHLSFPKEFHLGIVYVRPHSSGIQ